MSERWLGIDFGSKYVGLAIGEVGLSMAMPLKTIPAQPAEELFKALSELASTESLAGFVVGLPINMDGSEGPAAKICRDFTRQLAERTNLPVEMADERLSSWEAEGRLIEGGLKPSERKDRVHAVAAKIILEHFLARLKAGQQGEREDSDE
jgi:putative Holliday junction resolvase